MLWVGWVWKHDGGGNNCCPSVAFVARKKATFIQRIARFCTRVFVVIHLGRVLICSTPCVVTTLGGGCVLADLHWFHSCLCEPLQEHPGTLRPCSHGAIQQAPHGRDTASYLRCGERVLPLPLEAPWQPVYPHQVNCSCCCFDFPCWCALRGDLGTWFGLHGEDNSKIKQAFKPSEFWERFLNFALYCPVDL